MYIILTLYSVWLWTILDIVVGPKILERTCIKAGKLIQGDDGSFFGLALTSEDLVNIYMINQYIFEKLSILIK